MAIKLSRDEKCINMTKNYAIIMTGIMMISMTEALAGVAKTFGEGISAAFGSQVDGKEMKKWEDEFEENKKKIPQQVLSEIKDMKTQFDQQQKTDPAGLKKYISNPAFDEGIKIVEKYDFALPKITEPVDENVLSFYVTSILAEDEKTTRMYKELTAWFQTLPPPERNP